MLDETDELRKDEEKEKTHFHSSLKERLHPGGGRSKGGQVCM